jgi:3-methylfumaryl-CoA hydratase
MTHSGKSPQPVTELTADPTRLLRFGSSTRNVHRIHYDAEFARTQRLNGAVVMAQLHGCLFFRAAAEWVGDPTLVESLSWQNKAPAYAGSRLRVTAYVREIDEVAQEAVLDLEEYAEEVECARGRAVVGLRRGADTQG